MNLGDAIQNGILIGTALIVAVKWLLDKRKKLWAGLDKNQMIDAQIYPILWEIKDQYRAIRVFITQYHNGSKFYTGQHIQRMTVSHETCTRLFRKVKDYNDNVLISEMDHRVLVDVTKCQYYWINDRNELKGNELNEQIIDWMEVYQAQSMYVFRIIDKSTKETVATLHIHWTVKNPLSDLQVGEIMEMKKRLEAIFDKL